MKIRNTSIFLALGMTLAMTACSDPSKADKADKGSKADTEQSGDLIGNANSIIKQVSGGMYTVEKTFEGPDGSGLVGLVLEPAGGVGAKQIGWASPDGRFVSPGPLFDSNGQNLNESSLSEHGGLLSAEDLADRIMEDNMGFIAGKSGPVLTVFFEPYCGFCNRLFEDLKPRIDKGELRVRFLMVSFLRPDSAARASEIASAKDPYRALSQWESRKDKTSAPAAKGNAEKEAEIQQYGALFNEAQLGGTPAAIMCNSNNGNLEVIRGFPPNMGELLSNISSDGHKLCK